MRIRDPSYIFRDHDYIETPEGWIFCVVSDIHPPNKVCAFLKYIRGNGGWRRGSEQFLRMVKTYRMDEIAYTLDFLRKEKPEYIHYEDTIKEYFSYIPHTNVKIHYKCEEKACKIIENPTNDIEEAASRLMEKITDITGIPYDCLGITGSILAGLYNPRADVDLIIYGRDNFWEAVNQIPVITSGENISHVRNSFKVSLVEKYNISWREAEILSKRLANKGMFNGRYFSVHGVRLLEEIREKYGRIFYEPLGFYTVKLRIIDGKESCFTPALYYVEQINNHTLYRDYGLEVKTLTCYDTSFATLFSEGDVIEVYGKVEKVNDLEAGEEYLNVLIGSVSSSARERIRILEAF